MAGCGNMTGLHMDVGQTTEYCITTIPINGLRSKNINMLFDACCHARRSSLLSLSGNTFRTKCSFSTPT